MGTSGRFKVPGWVSKPNFFWEGELEEAIVVEFEVWKSWEFSRMRKIVCREEITRELSLERKFESVKTFQGLSIVYINKQMILIGTIDS